MTEVRVIPNCVCGHATWRRVLEMYQCKDPRCGCLRYGPKEQR